MTKKRIDILLTEKGLVESRTKARALLMAGRVFVDGQRVDKAGALVDEDSDIEIKEKFPYVSRGALKLQKAYEDFGLDFKDKVICDIGSSTGGFTDFSLKQGAKKVYAIDVGYGQLDQKLREDSRVVVMEKTNFRDIDSWEDFSKRVILACPGSKNYGDKADSGRARMTRALLQGTGQAIEPIDFFVCDVSFISLKKIIPKIKEIAGYPVQAILLIKPQFEVGKKIADRYKGVIKDKQIQLEVVGDISRFAEDSGFKVQGLTESPITGAKGNKEFLLWLEI